MTLPNLTEVLGHVEHVLAEHQDRVRFSVSRSRVYYSPAKILYVPVEFESTAPCDAGELIQRMNDASTKAAAVTGIDVFVIPDSPETPHD